MFLFSVHLSKTFRILRRMQRDIVRRDEANNHFSQFCERAQKRDAELSCEAFSG